MRGYTIGITILLLVLATSAALAFVLLPTFQAGVVLFSILATTSLSLVSTYKIWLWDLLNELAPRNIVVTNVVEGTGKMVMQNGEAVRFLTANYRTDPDENWYVIQEEDQTAAPPGRLRKKQRPMSELVAWIDRDILPGGMRWVGFKFMGYKLLQYNFRWEVLRSSEPVDAGPEAEEGLVAKEKQDNGKWVASFSQKDTNYIYLKDSVYYFEEMGAETKGHKQTDGKVDSNAAGMPVDIHCVITVRIVNPYLTLIFLHDWLETVFDLIRPSLRSWASQNYYEDILGKFEVAERNYDQLLNTSGLPEAELAKIPAGERPRSIKDYIECAYGIRIKRIGFDDVVPPDAYVAASEKRAAAEQDKIRIATEATAERDRLQIVAEGEAARIKIVVVELKNPDAMQLRKLEALEKVGENGNMVVLSGEHSQLLLSAPNNRTKGGS